MFAKCRKWKEDLCIFKASLLLSNEDVASLQKHSQISNDAFHLMLIGKLLKHANGLTAAKLR